VKFSLKYFVVDLQARAMPARGGRTQGPSRIPVSTSSNPERELRSATRGKNGVSKRKRLEIESSEADSTGSDDDEYLDYSDKIATFLSELATLVTALKENIEKQTKIIEKQTKTIENV
jgi:hypothetical protein